MNNLSFDQGLTFTIPIEKRRRELARRMHRERQHRVELIGTEFSQDVPWDILLVLYASEDRLKITSVQADVGAPPTTSLRWMKRLEAKGYIDRLGHQFDARIIAVGLTSKAKTLLNCFLDTYDPKLARMR